MIKIIGVALLVIVGIIISMAVGVSLAGFFYENKLQKTQEMSDKHLRMFQLMNQWVLVKQHGKKVEDYFHRREYKRIAIYGMGYIGERLVDELLNSDITISYGIDRNAECMHAPFELVSPESELKMVDVIIVTSVYYFEEIEDVLRTKVECPILSLEDILHEV